ncbi:hypothetical protein PG996_002588 [Apiospora saccharicola]|uniref:Uncharacterized protein n=1 Tax=Apiospora saccharicola TaxID=335842 RepID=A0ABR1WJZ2_9PEZI
MANVYIHRDDEHARMHFTLSNEIVLTLVFIALLLGATPVFLAWAIRHRGLLGCVHGRYCLCCAADRPSHHISGSIAAALGGTMTAQAKALADAQPANFEAIRYSAVQGATYTAIAEQFLGSTETTDIKADDKPSAAQGIFERLSWLR